MFKNPRVIWQRQCTGRKVALRMMMLVLAILSVFVLVQQSFA
jgi:hypothetical protein